MKTLNLGHIPYGEAYQLQKEFVEKVKIGEEETLILCSHPPIVTLGKKSTPQDIQGWQGDVLQIERGGKATYHGPEQIIIYPILDLKKRGQNIAGFLEAMESSMVKVLKEFDLWASGNIERGKPDFTGVWVCDFKGLDKGLEEEIKKNPQPYAKKIASIGVAVSRWITYHGLAFNLNKDPLAFQGISPCGFTTDTMTSLEEVLQRKVERSVIEDRLVTHLCHSFSNLLS